MQHGAVSGEPWVQVKNGLPLPTMDNLHAVIVDTMWMSQGRIHEFDCPEDAPKCKTPDRSCTTIEWILSHCRESGLLISYPECLALLIGLRKRSGQ
jgi:hypothetical protein